MLAIRPALYIHCGAILPTGGTLAMLFSGLLLQGRAKFLLPSLAILCSMVAGCGEKDERTVLRYARWGLPDEIRAEQELLKEFEANNPDIRVVVEYASWSEYWNKLQAQIAAGTAPDVMLIGGTHAHDYARRGVLEDLNPFLEEDPEAPDLEAFFPAALDLYRFNDGFWAMPRDCNTLGIYYNKTLFRKHGVPLPAPDWTWEEFHEAARALTIDESGDGRFDSYGFLCSFESLEVNWGPWVWQNGGQILNKERTRAMLDSPEAIEAMEFYTGMVVNDRISPDMAQAATFGSNMFVTGRLAMSQEGSWMIRTFSRIDNFEWAIAPLPKGETRAASVNGVANAMYGRSANKDAAWRLIKFLSSPLYQEQLARSGTSIPVIQDVAYSPTYLSGDVEGKEYFLEQIETVGRVVDFTPGFARWESAARNQLELVWLGRKSVADAMRDATREINAILASNEARAQ